MSPGLDEVDRLRASFRAARARCPATLRCRAFEFAGRPVRFDLVGTRLATSIERVFAGLAVPGEPAAAPLLRAEMWDEDETGVSPSLRVDGIRSSEDGRLVLAGGEGWVGAYDRARCRLIAALRPASLPRVDYAPPFKLLLLTWYGDHGCHLLHAGLVMAPDGKGVLLAAAGKSGKSTTVFACVNAGFAALSDDCIAVEQAPDGRFVGHGIFSSLFVDRDTVRLFGGVGTPEPRDERGREIVSVAADRPGAWRAGATVAAIVLPRLTPSPRSALTRIGAGEALRMLLSAAMAVDPRGVLTRRGFTALTALLDRVPCYRLAVGSDPRGIPDAVAMALENASG